MFLRKEKYMIKIFWKILYEWLVLKILNCELLFLENLMFFCKINYLDLLNFKFELGKKDCEGCFFFF